jgi:valyl-tRNA synthetase
MTNIQDWCISRQLWWGHRIPAYYAPDGSFAVAATKEEAFAQLKAKNPTPELTDLVQDEDVLDTWFSSWLWPLTTLGWDGTNAMDTDDFNAFYPTTTLVTGPDIIFFWVARMIMAGLYFKKEIPFRNVYFTSIIRDGQGRKMSKSLGNSPNPLDVIEKYGADALRFTTIYLAPLGQDVRMEVTKDQDTPQVEQGRNFATKIWNAARFLLMNRNESFESLDDFAAHYALLNLAPSTFTLTERWIFSRLNQTLQAYHHAHAQFRVNDLAKLTYDFIWGDFCDWFIEAMKVNLQTAQSAEEKRNILCRAFFVFEESLKMLHPIMPFITEEIWQTLVPRAEGAFLDTTPISHGEEAWHNEQAEQEFELLKKIITEIRSIRAVLGVPPAPIAQVQVKASTSDIAERFLRERALVERLSRASITVSTDLAKPKHAASAMIDGNELYILLEGLIDFEKEKARLTKEIQKLETYIKQLESKLSNEGFVARAPKEVIDAEREKSATAKATLAKLQENLASLG